MGWEAANARARGLATHLLPREVLVRAAEAGSWGAAGRALAARGYPVGERDLVTRADFDRAVGRIASARMRVLERWLGRRRQALAVLYELEDRHSLRRLVRGAAQGSSPDARLQGITPTPDLSERLLHRLAGARSPEALVALLLRAGHPAGRALRGAKVGRTEPFPGLWEADLALNRLFAVRVTRAARGGGKAVRRFASLCIDLENAWSLLAVPDWGAEVRAADVFLPGGAVLDPAAFTELASPRRSDDVRWRALAARFTATPLAAVFREAAGPADLERKAAEALVAWQRAEARRDPLSVATVLAVLLRIRSEAHDVRLLTFGLDLGAPAPAIVLGLETAA